MPSARSSSTSAGVGVGVVCVDDGDRQVAEHAARDRIPLQAIEVVDRLAQRCRIAAQRAETVARAIPVADLRLVRAHGVGQVLGHEVGDLHRVERPGQRAAHVEELAELGGEMPGLRDVHRTGERGRRLVREDQQQPEIVVVELAQAELGQGDDADQMVIVLHRHDQHRLVHVVGARDRPAPRIARGVVDAECRPAVRDPAGESLADLGAQDLEVHLLVRPDAALEGDGHQVVGRIEQVDARVVVVDDALGLLDDRPADVRRREVGAHPAGRVPQHLELRVAPGLGRSRSTDEPARDEQRAADRQVEDEDDVVEGGRAATEGPAQDPEREDEQPADHGDRVQARLRGEGTTSRPAKIGEEALHDPDAAIDRRRRAPV